MLIDLTPEDIETLLTSIEYSKDRVRSAEGTPNAVRHENLERLDAAAQRLRKARRELAGQKELQCECCRYGTPTQGPRICPICGHEFQGNGWDGIDTHWRANHEDDMSYEQFWQSLCEEHRG